MYSEKSMGSSKKDYSNLSENHMIGDKNNINRSPRPLNTSDNYHLGIKRSKNIEHKAEKSQARSSSR